MRTRFLLFSLVVFTLGAGAAQAQGFSVSGTWNLDATVALPNEGGTCQYSGQANVSNDNGSLSGFAELFLDSGANDCPAEMSADLTGQGGFDGPDFFLSGMLLGGQLGEASFSGQLSPNPGGEGAFSVTSGPFTDSSGNWTAEKQLAAVGVIPNLTPVGLTLFLLLVLATGYFFLERRESE